MYISISKKDLPELRVDAIIRLEEDNESKKKWLKLEITKINAKENLTLGELSRPPIGLNYKNAFVSAIKKASEEKYKTIAIPVVSSFISLRVSAIIQVIRETINWDHDFLIEGIFNREEYPEQIVLIVDNDIILKDLKATVRWKKYWSKVRKLSYILDFLDLSLSKDQIFERHFVNDKNYKKYLGMFSEEEELEFEFLKNTLRSYKGENDEIKQFVEKLNELRKSYLSMNEENIKPLYSLFYNEFNTNSKLLNKFFDLLYDTNPLIPYFKHLAPDDQWEQIHKMANPDNVNRQAKEIISNYNYLVLLLKKIKSLQGTDLPIDMLKDHWDDVLWGDVMSSDPRAIQTQVKKALARRHNCELNTIEKEISHKGK